MGNELHSFGELTQKTFHYLSENEAIGIGNLGDQKLIHYCVIV